MAFDIRRIVAPKVLLKSFATVGSLGFLGILVALLLKNRRSRRRLELKIQARCRLVFGGSGALVSYNMGFMHHIVCRHRERLQACCFEGLSGGSALAGYTIASVHGVYDLRYWYSQHVRKLFENAESRLLGFFFSTARITKGLGTRYFELCSQKCGEKVPYFLRHGKYVAWVTDTAAGFQSVPLTELSTAEAFGGAMSASSYLPFFTAGPKLWECVEGHSGAFIDGCMAVNVGDRSVVALRPADCRTVLFETLPHSSPNLSLEEQAHTRIYRCHEFGNYNPYTEVILWGNTTWADDLFNRGVRDAELQEANIDSVLDWLDGKHDLQ